MNKVSELRENIWQGLREIYDPEIGCSIVDLGLVYNVEVDEKSAKVVMTLTSPGCPLHDVMVGGVRQKVRSLPGVGEVEVNVVWDPPWSPAMMSEELKRLFRFEHEME